MRDYPTISKSNEPKEPSMWDNIHRKVDDDMEGIDEALLTVGQLQEYKGGQMDLFPNELIEHSSLFLGVLEENK